MTLEFFKSSAFKTASATIGSIGAILGTLWALDSHYASAADLENIQKAFAQQIQQIRASDIDDKIFMLEIKKNTQQGQLDPVDAAMLDRYTRQQKTLQFEQLKSQQVPAK